MLDLEYLNELLTLQKFEEMEKELEKVENSFKSQGNQISLIVDYFRYRLLIEQHQFDKILEIEISNNGIDKTEDIHSFIILSSLIIQSYFKLGKFDETQNLLNNIPSINPSSETKLGQIAQLELINLENVYGSIYGIKGEFNSALEKYEHALEMIESFDNPNSLFLQQIEASIIGNMGVIFDYEGEIETSLKYYNEALNINLKLQNPYFIATNYNNIGVIYKLEGKLDQALFHFLKSVEYYEKLENSHLISGVYNNIGSLYRLLGEIDKAMEYQKMAYDIIKPINDYRELAITHDEIGRLYREKHDYEKSRQHLETSINYYKKIKGNDVELSKTYFELILTLIEMNEYETVTKIVNEMKEQDQDNPRVEFNYRLIQAIIKKNTKSLDALYQSKTDLKDLLELEIIDFEMYVIALMHLIDLNLEEYMMMGHVSAELDSSIKRLEDISIQYKSKNLQIWALIFQTRKLLIEENYNIALKTVQDALKLGEVHNLTYLIHKLMSLQNSLLKKIIETKVKSIFLTSDADLDASIEDHFSITLDGKLSIEPLNNEPEYPIQFILLSKSDTIILNISFSNSDFETKTILDEFKKIRMSVSILENVNKIIFGDTTVVWDTINSFTAIYIFKRNPFLGQKRFELLIDVLTNYQSSFDEDVFNEEEFDNLKELITQFIIPELNISQIESDTIDIDKIHRSHELKIGDENLDDDLKVFLDPIRIAMMKFLFIYNKIPASDLRKILKINWSSFNWHLKVISEKKYVEEVQEFIQTTRSRVLYLTPLGYKKYIEFVNYLNELI